MTADTTVGAGVIRDYFLKQFASVFSFTFCYQEKASPSHIQNTLRKFMVAHHPTNIQGFNGDHVKPLHKAGAEFVVKILARIGNSAKGFSNKLASLCTVCAAFLFARHPALQLRQLISVLLQGARVGNRFARAERAEIFHAHINAYALTSLWQRLWLFQCADQQRKPAIGAARDSELLDRAFERPGQSHPTSSDARHGQLVALQRTAAHLFNLLAERVVSITRFESRKPRLSFGRTLKECLKRLIQLVQRIRLDAAQTRFHFRQFIAGFGQLAGLLKQAQALTCGAVMRDAVFQRAVVDKSGLLQRAFTRGDELFVRPELVFISADCILGFSHSVYANFINGIGENQGCGANTSLIRPQYTSILTQTKTNSEGNVSHLRNIQTALAHSIPYPRSTAWTLHLPVTMFFSDDAANLRLGDTSERGNLTVRIPFPLQVKNLLNFAVTKLALPALFSLAGNVSLFLAHVAHVIRVCAKSQMVWVNASRVIAFVKYAQVARLSLEKKIRNAMRTARMIFQVKIPISRGELISLPLPAIIRIVRDGNFGKKPFYIWICSKKIDILTLHIASLIFRLFAKRLEARTSQPQTLLSISKFNLKHYQLSRARGSSIAPLGRLSSMDVRLNGIFRKYMSKTETFSTEEIKSVIRQFLQYGEDGSAPSLVSCQPDGNKHLGYYSGDGFAARVLRYHLEQLENRRIPLDVLAVLQGAEAALSSCYDVTEYPASDDSKQARALAVIQALIAAQQ